MKNRLAFLVLLTALLAGFTATAEGQGLGDAAKREAERRAKLKDAAKVLTNDDDKTERPAPHVKTAAPAAHPDTPVPPAAAAAKPAADEKAAAEGDAADKPTVRDKRPEDHWRERAKVIRDRLDRLRADAAAIEGRVAQLQTELQSATGPRAAALASEIEQSNKELARFRADERLIDEEWTKFEERARAAKIPQAWIR